MPDLTELLKTAALFYLICCALFWQGCASLFGPLLRRHLRQRSRPDAALREALARIRQLEVRLAAGAAPHEPRAG